MPVRDDIADPVLGLLGATVDDLEGSRIAATNRYRQLIRNEPDQDGLERGFGLSLDDPRVASLRSLIEGLTALEEDAIKILQKRMREHPLGPWVKKTIGVGEKQLARLLTVIGDPFWHSKENRPRKVSELWAYCGLHTVPSNLPVFDPSYVPESGEYRVAPVRRRGERANWSTLAKTRAYLIAESCIKAKSSPYRKVYDETRERYEDALHAVECKRCGPSGKPAQPGSPLSKGHQHARAMRAMMQEILKDLWLESRRLHGYPEDPPQTVFTKPLSE